MENHPPPPQGEIIPTLPEISQSIILLSGLEIPWEQGAHEIAVLRVCETPCHGLNYSVFVFNCFQYLCKCI